MSDNAKVIVGCTHGEEDPDRVVVSYLTAGAALDQGKEVVMWLSSEGVRLALRGYVDPIREGKEPPVKRLHEQFIEKGGRFFVCPVCFADRALDEDDLVQGAELKGATPLIQFAGEGATTFSTDPARRRSTRGRDLLILRRSQHGGGLARQCLDEANATVSGVRE